MTVDQALQILQGDPSQEEVFAALLALAEQDEMAYVGALPRALEILEAQNPGQGISREQINSVVRELQTQTVSQDATTQPQGVEIAGGVQPVPEDPTVPTTVGAPPPPPPEEDPEQQFVSPPIGVPPDFRAERAFEGTGPAGATPGGVGQADTFGIPPRYAAGDEFQFQYASPTEIRRMQKELEAAGLLEPGTYTPGFWDQASADALQTAMGYGNRGGTTYEQVIEQLKELPRQVDPAEFTEFVPPTEVKPDPAAIEQRVKAEFRGRLGREPTAEELAEFGGYMTAQYGARHAQEEAAARRQFAETHLSEVGAVLGDEGLAGQIGGLLEGAASASRGEGQVIQDVDPAARLQQLFDRRFGPEVEFIENQADRVRNSENVYASLRSMTGLIGS